MRRKVRYVLIAVDMLVVILAYTLVWQLLSASTAYPYFQLFRNTVVFACVLYPFCLFMLHSYKSIWEYAGLWDYLQCVYSCAFTMLLLVLCGILFSNLFLPARESFLAGIFIIFGTVSARALARILRILRNRRSRGCSKGERINLLIIGAGSGAKHIISDIKKTERRYRIIGLIDDDESKLGRSVGGIEVLGNRNHILPICRKYEVREILLAIPSLDNIQKKQILDICNRTGCKVRILPQLSEIIDNQKLVHHVRDVQIEDLLSRSPVKLDNKKISEYIKEKTVLVTGGGGSIGAELCRQIARFKPKRLLILDIYENNAYEIENELKMRFPALNIQILIASVRDYNRIDSIFDKEHPDIIFHAAAHKHVPLMEYNPMEAVKNNVFGTLNVAKCAHKYRADRFVLISTDKAVNPTNIMGATKRICEKIVQSISTVSETKFAAVRFGNVLGSNGSVVPLFQKMIQQGRDLTITHREITRFFMTISEAAQLVLEAGSYAKNGEIFVLDMGEPVKIYDLAVNMIRLSGLEPGRDIGIQITGLRPGEKLYEEILLDEEGLTATMHDKIFVAKPMQFDWEKLCAQLEELRNIANGNETRIIREKVKELVPTFHEEKAPDQDGPVQSEISLQGTKQAGSELVGRVIH